MPNFLTLVIADYMQRTRGYAFLVTLCAALALGYSFVPPMDASYSTISIGDYVGRYTSTWIAYVIAIMSSVFISLFGFFLVNSSLEKDYNSSVGVVMASSVTSNLNYLLSKLMSNVLVLISIAIPVFCMGILLFFVYGDESDFMFLEFLRAFAIVSLPTIFFIGALGVVFDVLFRNKPVLQYCIFFTLFTFMLVPNFNELYPSLDPFGIQLVTNQMVEQVTEISQKEPFLNIGFVINQNKNSQTFTFLQPSFPWSYLFARLGWIVLGLFLVFCASFVFNRFKSPMVSDRSVKKQELVSKRANFSFELDTPLNIDYSLTPLIKTELLLIFRNTSKWIWLLTLILLCLASFVPISFAHIMVLPGLWFIHVTTWSQLFYKEYENGVNQFSSISFRPIKRLFTSQLFAGVIFSLLLSLPIIVRYAIAANWQALYSIVIGAIIVIALASLLVTISKSRKLFEVIFFMLSYANINSVPHLDYFGSLHASNLYLIVILSILLSILCASYVSKIIVKDV